jgi:hypothetical protein
MKIRQAKKRDERDIQKDSLHFVKNKTRYKLLNQIFINSNSCFYL